MIFMGFSNNLKIVQRISTKINTEKMFTLCTDADVNILTGHQLYVTNQGFTVTSAGKPNWKYDTF